MKTGCVSIVIPIYNEEANLPELLRRCLEMGRTLDRAFEIVLVDDGSKDGSRQMLNAAAERDPAHVVAVLLNRNYGQHAAVMAGLAQARGDIVVTLDGDLQNPPEEVPKLVAAVDDGSRRRRRSPPATHGHVVQAQRVTHHEPHHGQDHRRLRDGLRLHAARVPARHRRRDPHERRAQRVRAGARQQFRGFAHRGHRRACGAACG